MAEPSQPSRFAARRAAMAACIECDTPYCAPMVASCRTTWNIARSGSRSMSADTGADASSSAVEKSAPTGLLSNWLTRSKVRSHRRGSWSAGQSRGSGSRGFNSSVSTRAPRSKSASICSCVVMICPHARSSLRSVSRTLNGSGMPSAIRCLTVDKGQHCISPAPFEVRRRANCHPTRPGAVCTFDTLRADMNAGFVGAVCTALLHGASAVRRHGPRGKIVGWAKRSVPTGLDGR